MMSRIGTIRIVFGWGNDNNIQKYNWNHVKKVKKPYTKRRLNIIFRFDLGSKIEWNFIKKLDIENNFII